MKIQGIKQAFIIRLVSAKCNNTVSYTHLFLCQQQLFLFNYNINKEKKANSLVKGHLYAKIMSIPFSCRNATAF